VSIELEYHETPVIEIVHPSVQRAGVRLLIKREDLNHPTISGNKWWKLKYNLQAAHDLNLETVLTFGGAYSNHIYSTAAACREAGLRAIGIVRGEEHSPLNPTLDFAANQGMHLHYVSRSAYRERTKPDFIKELEVSYGPFYSVPEGGTNMAGIRGSEEFVNTLTAIDYDVIFLPVGTGGTIAGVIAGHKGHKKIIGIPVLKAGDFLRIEVESYLREYRDVSFSNWTLLADYHHGGYAKFSEELIDFILMMRRECNLPLDQVYTGKMLFAIFSEIIRGAFPRGTTLLAIHTGGLQGSIVQ
jgi:1-aminocyclopropane-1-carboxylate deaminase